MPPSTGKPGGGGGGIGGGTICALATHARKSTKNSAKFVFFFILYPPRLNFEIFLLKNYGQIYNFLEKKREF